MVAHLVIAHACHHLPVSLVARMGRTIFPGVGPLAQRVLLKVTLGWNQDKEKERHINYVVVNVVVDRFYIALFPARSRADYNYDPVPCDSSEPVWPSGKGVRLVSGRTSVRYRFGSPFSSKRLWFVDTVL